jgi:2-oxoglutarate dehydrogenase E2 component (dihydrolipoamide succinyltransferase)
MVGEIIVPTLGESVVEATVAKWFKQPGDAVKADEPLVELETDKVTIEVNAPAAGILKDHAVKQGATVGVGSLLGNIEVGAAGGKAVAAAPAAVPTPAPVAAPIAAASPAAPSAANGPAVAKLAAENPQVNVAAIAGSGKDGRVTKGDMLTALEGDGFAASPAVGPREERVKMTKLRQTIARRLKESQILPRF